MAYNPIEDNLVTPQKDVEAWMDQYAENHLEIDHSTFQHASVTPDESVLVIGPPRLMGTDLTEFNVIGLVNMFNYNESSIVQPMKAIGSKRYLFARTNNPVSGTIGRMVVDGPNLYKTLYQLTDTTIPAISHNNAKFALNGDTDNNWYSNLEEHLFRVPLGIGIIYRSPGKAVDPGTSGPAIVGADYLENVVLQNRSIGVQSGQAMLFEQVTFMADRVVPFSGRGS